MSAYSYPPIAIIVFNPTLDTHDLYNEDGRLTHRGSPFMSVKDAADRMGYEIVGVRTRPGRTILDMIGVRSNKERMMV